MKYVAALVLLALSFVAQAEHHRGHALDLLRRADNSLSIVENYLTKYLSEAEAGDYLVMHSLRYRIGLVRSKNETIKAILEDPNGDLDAARIMVQQPDYAASTGSIAKFYFGFDASWELVSYWDDTDGDIVGRQLAYSGFTYTRIAWHINDAIREEIYNDPVFTCSGDGNHCSQ